MSKLRRIIEDPIHSDIERPINVTTTQLPDNQYFNDDAENKPYYTNTDKTNNYVSVDE